MKKIVFVILFFILGWISSSDEKSQFIRLVDIFIYGPFLIYLSSIYKTKNNYIETILLFMGVTTISYNLKNYLFYKKQKTINTLN